VGTLVKITDNFEYTLSLQFSTQLFDLMINE